MQSGVVDPLAVVLRKPGPGVDGIWNATTYPEIVMQKPATITAVTKRIETTKSTLSNNFLVVSTAVAGAIFAIAMSANVAQAVPAVGDVSV